MLNFLSQKIGYPHDVGFNQLLHPSVADVRRLLLWLVERREAMPRLGANDSVYIPIVGCLIIRIFNL